MQPNSDKLITIDSLDIHKPILEFLTKYIHLYTNSKKAMHLSEKTIYNIHVTLKRFYNYIALECGENNTLTLNDINKYFLNNYLNKLTNDNIGKNTQKLHLTIIKGFILFIAASDIKNYKFLKSSIENLKIKTEQKEKDSFSQNDQKELINHLNTLDMSLQYLSQRNSLILKMLLFTGLRISELINIKWSDITEYQDDNHGLIYSFLIQGKGNKERFIYLTHDLVHENIQYLQKKRYNNVFLFTTTHGNQCNRSMLYVVVNHLLLNAGISKTGLHIFRHTFARNLVNKDINLATIKDLLGHTNISMTAQFYAKSDEKAKKNALFVTKN